MKQQAELLLLYSRKLVTFHLQIGFVLIPVFIGMQIKLEETFQRFLMLKSYFFCFALHQDQTHDLIKQRQIHTVLRKTWDLGVK